MTRPTTGIRRMDSLEGGGLLVCLYGETDLDDVMLAVVQELAAQRDGTEEWIAKSFVAPDLPRPTPPDSPVEDREAWAPWHAASVAWRKAGHWVIDEEHPTDAVLEDIDEVEAGWFRKTPCPPQMCGEHGWHWNHADEGSHAAFLGVHVSSRYA